MKNGFEAAVVGLAAFLALMGAAFSRDALFQAHAWVLFFVLVVSTVILIRRVKFFPDNMSVPDTSDSDTSGYMDGVIRYGIIATIFWGLAGFLVGVLIASQMAWPVLNIEPWFNFGRLRPLHTSAVIFAFGGNALIATSFYGCPYLQVSTGTHDLAVGRGVRKMKRPSGRVGCLNGATH